MGNIQEYIQKKHKRIAQGIAFLFMFCLLISSVLPVFAAFNPGDTLDPGCLPSDPDCTVLISSGATTTWGAIVGTLSDQTDLQNALDGKLSVADFTASSTAVFNDLVASSTTLPAFINYWTKTGGDLSYIGGSIGIGTTTPTTALSVVGTTTIFGSFEVRPSTSTVMSFPGSGNLFNVAVHSNTTGSRPQYQMERYRGTESVPLAVQQNDYLGSVSFRGFDGTGVQQGGQIDSYVDGPVSAGSVPSRISFTTGTNSGDRAERLTIKSDGKIGIGTTTPGSMLTVIGTTTATCFSVDEGATCLSSGGSGTVTSVGLSVPTGLSVSGSPVTTSGTLAISLDSGYVIPLTASTTNWNDFYDTPSTRITAGTGLSWAGNTLNATGGGSGTVNSGTSGQVAFYDANGTAVSGTSTLTISGSGITTTGTTTLGGNVVVTGNIIPNGSYSLGTLENPWHDLYVSSSSIYINGQKVLATDPSQNVNITADVNQSLILKTFGSGDVELNPSGTGVIALKGNVQLTGGKTFNTSDNSAIIFTDGVGGGNLSVAANTIIPTNTNGSLNISATGTGAVYVGLGNFGIGTTTPESKLTVSGNSYVTGTSTAACFTVDGVTCITSGGGSGTVNSGTLGQVAFYAADGTALSGTSTLFFNNGNVGIGTTSPGYKLTINPVSDSDGVFISQGNQALSFNPDLTTGAWIAGGVQPNNTKANNVTGTDGVGRIIFQGAAAEGLQFQTAIAGSPSWGTKMTIKNNGNVGIGTTTPLDKLVVSGGNVVATGPEFQASFVSMVTGSSNTWYFGGCDSSADSNCPANGAVIHRAGVGSPFAIDSSGNIGIGTVSPSEKLSVNGNIQSSSLDGGGNQCLRANNDGVIELTGSDCSVGGGSGTVNSGTAGQVAFYNANGTAVSGTSSISIANEAISVTGSNSRSVTINPRNSGSGELLDAPALYANGTSLNILPDGSGTDGNQLVMSYFNGSNFFSALEYENVASGFSKLNLMKSGGEVNIGRTAALFGETLSVNGAALFGAQTGGAGSVYQGNLGSGAPATIYLNSDTSKQISIGMGLPGGSPTFTDDLVFSTFSSGPQWVEKMRLTNAGLLGIGTDSPNNELTVAGDVDISGNVAIGATSSAFPLTISSSGSNNKLLLTGGTTQNGMTFASANGGDEFYVFSGELGYSIYNNTDTRYDFTISNSGNVGIGTTTPGSKLTVAGTTTATCFSTNGGASCLNDGSVTGSNTQIQYNNSGVLGASADFIFDDATNKLGLGGYGTIEMASGNTAGYLTHQYGSDTLYDYLSLANNFRRTSGAAGTIPNASFESAEILLSSQTNVGTISLRTSGAVNTVPVDRLTVQSDGDIAIDNDIELDGTLIFSNNGSSIGSDGDALYITGETGQPTYFSQGSNYNMVLNGDGLSINNGTTGPGSGNGLVVATGDVGIGTNNPVQKLDVRGSIAQGDGSDGLVFQNDSSVAQIIGVDPAVAVGYNDIRIKTGAFDQIYLKTNGVTYFNAGNVGIGTSTPDSRLTVQATRNTSAGETQTTWDYGDSADTYLGVAGFYAPNQNVAGDKIQIRFGVSPSTGNATEWRYNHQGNNDATNFSSFAFYGYADPVMSYLRNGNVGIGTTTPSSKLTVSGSGWFGGNVTATGTLAVSGTGTSTIAGDLNIGSGNILYNNSLGLTTISNLQLGAASFDSDSGMLSWIDMPVTSSAASSSVQSYSAQIDGNPMLTVYSLADGAGGTAYRGVGIGTTTPTATLSVAGTIAFNGLTSAASSYDALCRNSATGEITYNIGTQTCTVSSARFKHDINTLTATSGLEFVKQLRPVSFALNGTNEARLGFIAEEVYALDSRLVGFEADGITPRTVRYEEMTAVLAKAVQELDAKLASSTFGIATSTNFLASVSEALASLTEWSGQKITAVFGIFSDLTVGSSEKPTGITLYTAHGDPYCLRLNLEGEPESTPGVCTVVVPEEDEDETPIIEDSPAEEDDNASTTPEVVDETGTSTPDVIEEDTASSTPETEEETTVEEIQPEEEIVDEPEVVEAPESEEPTEEDTNTNESSDENSSEVVSE